MHCYWSYLFVWGIGELIPQDLRREQGTTSMRNGDSSPSSSTRCCSPYWFFWRRTRSSTLPVINSLFYFIHNSLINDIPSPHEFDLFIVFEHWWLRKCFVNEWITIITFTCLPFSFNFKIYFIWFYVAIGINENSSKLYSQ